MFVDFKSAIKNKNSNEKMLPKALVDYLSSKLPNGVKYKQIEAGVLIIIPTEKEEMRVSGLTPKLNEHQKEVLGSSFSFRDIIKYADNSQLPIELIPEDGEHVIINGQQLLYTDVLRQPMNKDKSSFVQYIYPKQFPEPRNIKLSAEDVTLNIKIHRIPDDSIDTIVYTSDDTDIVTFVTKYFENEHKATFKIIVNGNNIKTVKDLIKAMTIYTAFMNRTLKLDGFQMSKDTSETNQFSDSTIKFWKKVLAIEEALNLSFIPEAKDIPYEKIAEVERLYQSVIHGIPIIANFNVDSISGKWEAIEEVAQGKDLMLIFGDTAGFDLFEQKFELPCITCVFHATIDHFENEGEEKRVFLRDVDDNKKRFTSVLYFSSEKELESYNAFENTEAFYNAKKVSEYID